VDAVLQPEEINYDLVEALEALAPFGMGNPEPVFMLDGIRVADLRVLKERHLKLRLVVGERNLEAIGFNMADKRDVPEIVAVAFSLQINEWNGRKSVQLRIRDIKAAGHQPG
jgi:single-stranded-DNA-specific exonuclease